MNQPCFLVGPDFHIWITISQIAVSSRAFVYSGPTRPWLVDTIPVFQSPVGAIGGRLTVATYRYADTCGTIYGQSTPIIIG